MQLTFEIVQQLTTGSSPDALHLEDNTAKIFYIDNTNAMLVIDTFPTLGEWEDAALGEPASACNDTNIQNMMVTNIPRYNACGCWISGDKHRFAILR